MSESNVTNNDETRLRRLRREFRNRGLAIHKDRARLTSSEHLGGYMAIAVDGNYVVTGANYEATLDDLENLRA